MNNNDLRFIQDQIGYNFNNDDLLQQAFTRRSYSAENGGEDNEVLEFIGDKVLDFVIVKLLTEKYGYMLSECDDFDSNKEFDEFACEKNEAELTELKKTLVQRKTLAKRIDLLDFADLLITGKSDEQNNVNEKESVKEDLFEAIIGAVAVDSNWNIDEMLSVVEIMLDPDTLLEYNVENNCVTLVQEWIQKEYNSYPEFHYDNSSYSDENSFLIFANEIRSRPKRGSEFCVIDVQKYYQTHFKCWICILDKKFIGYGNSKSEARKDVCELVYRYLEENDLLHTIHDEIKNPNKNDAINQLETLARRGYFSIPVYTFDEQHDSNGNPIWNCKCKIAGESKTFSAKSSSKKDAKKTVAFKMLTHVLK